MYSQGSHFLPQIMTAQILVVFETWCFYSFRKLRLKKFKNFAISNPVVGYMQIFLFATVKILGPNATVQMFLVSEV